MHQNECDRLFEAMVESVGVKAFAAGIGVTSRQVHRMLSGAQVNPLTRFCQVSRACDETSAQQVLDYLCQSRGGYFVSAPGDFKQANLNAVKESAEAIVAISEGRSSRVTLREIREAIAALAALEKILAAPPSGVQ